PVCRHPRAQPPPQSEGTPTRFLRQFGDPHAVRVRPRPRGHSPGSRRQSRSLVTLVRQRNPVGGRTLRRLSRREEGEAMSPARNWREVKAEARRLQPEMDNPEVRAAASARLDTYVAGHHLKELRKSVGKSQAEVAAALGVSQSRVSQIENGDLSAMELDT